MNYFHWADLAHESSQSGHVMVICELPDEDLKRVDVEEGHAVFVAKFSQS